MSTIDEDLNHSEATRATGYHGKNSEVSWIKHLSSNMKETADELGYVDDPQRSSVYPQISTADANYHLDGQWETPLAEGNPFELPPPKMAGELTGLYFRHVNRSLPIIREDLFKKQCSQLYKGGSLMPGKKWMAVFHLVLAIGARFHRIAHAEALVDDVALFAKAQSVDIADTILKDKDDLQQVQVQCLLAFYFLVSSQINKYAPRIKSLSYNAEPIADGYTGRGK